MRKTSLVVSVWVGLVAFAPAAIAGPITGSTLAGDTATSTTNNSAADSREADGVGTTTALFDLSGLPLLRIGAPSFLQLAQRNKLRAPGDSPLMDDQGGGGGGGGGESIGNVGGGPVINPGGGGSGDPGPNAIPEPGLLLLMGSGLAIGLARVRNRRVAA